MGRLLDTVQSPEDLRRLSYGELAELASEIRTLIVETVTTTGGHLGSNLGVVELTLAIHRVFRSPEDVIVWDTGHQAYVHKLVTGRRDRFGTLRQAGGLSGYPSRRESPHDWVENSHASTALSYAHGIATAFRLTGQEHRRVIAVVGDGALTGGMAYEALNNLGHSGTRVLIVLNDNGRSYAPTISRLSEGLAYLRLNPSYVQTRERLRRLLRELPVVGPAAYAGIHGITSAVREVVTPHQFFEALGVRYAGPINGHDIAHVERALAQATQWPGPIVVHVLTVKGRGYAPAEQDEVQRLHDVKAGALPRAHSEPRPSDASAATLDNPQAPAAPGIGRAAGSDHEPSVRAAAADDDHRGDARAAPRLTEAGTSQHAPATSTGTSHEPEGNHASNAPAGQGQAASAMHRHSTNSTSTRDRGQRSVELELAGLEGVRAASTYTEAFSAALLELAARRPEVVAITAAMPGPTGLLPFARRYPERFFDVGIAEQHAVTAAAGMAMAGLRPVVAIYSTFFSRAFDQANLDVGLHGLPVVFVLDRAGITGDDGPSHHGVLDLVLTLGIPGMTVLAPSAAEEVPVMLAAALEQQGPVAIRFPKTPARHVAPEDTGEGLEARRSRRGDGSLCVLAVGKLVEPAEEAVEKLAAEGIDATLYDVRAVAPPDPTMLADALEHRVVVTVEDGLRLGGAGTFLADAMRQAAAPGAALPQVIHLGVPRAYLAHGKPDTILAQLGLDAAGIADVLRGAARA
jgi:deoxyxylulose-5-phosphate synthase